MPAPDDTARAAAASEGFAAIEPGRVLAATYRLVAPVSDACAQGVLWRALVVGGAQRALVLVLPPGAPWEQAAERGFDRASELQHPQLAKPIDVGVDGVPFIVYEWLDGEPLAAALGARRIGYADAVRLGAQLLDALAVAHAAGVAHGAIDAASVLLVHSSRGQLAPKLIGLGLTGATPADATRDVRAVVALLAVAAGDDGTATDRALASFSAIPRSATAVEARALLAPADAPQRARAGARLAVTTAPSMKRAMHEVADFQTSELAAIPAEDTLALLTGEARALPASEPEAPPEPAGRASAGLHVVALTGRGPRPGRTTARASHLATPPPFRTDAADVDLPAGRTTAPSTRPTGRPTHPNQGGAALAALAALDRVAGPTPTSEAPARAMDPLPPASDPPSTPLIRWAGVAVVVLLASMVFFILGTSVGRDSVVVRAPALDASATVLHEPGPRPGGLAPTLAVAAAPSVDPAGRTEPAPVTRLELASVPSGAIVSHDGVVLGPTPLSLDIPAGSHRFDLAAPGHEAQSVSLDVRGAQRLNHVVELRPRP